MARDPLHVRALRKLLPSRMLPRVVERLDHAHSRLDWLEHHVDLIREALGRIEARQLEILGHRGLDGAAFRAYSQWGEDGAIEQLVRRVRPREETFVEIGVESYDESNTRFLLVHRNWRGLVVDGNAGHVERIRGSRYHWRHGLTAVAAFVTRENVDALVRSHGFDGELGLLSIDLDGVDWWIWEALECVRPAIVVTEYNWRFGPDAAVTVPYRADFDRRRAHHSLTYFGASLAALCRLARRKGYVFVGCEPHGVNAFFVRSDLDRDGVPELTAQQGFVAGRFREAHDERGRRVEMSPADECAIVRGMPVVEVGEDGRVR